MDQRCDGRGHVMESLSAAPSAGRRWTAETGPISAARWPDTVMTSPGRATPICCPPNQKHPPRRGMTGGQPPHGGSSSPRGIMTCFPALLSDLVSSRESPVIWDGLRRGSYTSGTSGPWPPRKIPRMAGTDISKPILRSAAKLKAALRGLWPPPSTCRLRRRRWTFCWTASLPWRWRNSGEC